jgi:hypothetical protein
MSRFYINCPSLQKRQDKVYSGWDKRRASHPVPSNPATRVAEQSLTATGGAVVAAGSHGPTTGPLLLLRNAASCRTQKCLKHRRLTDKWLAVIAWMHG